jgi:L-asparaginase
VQQGRVQGLRPWPGADLAGVCYQPLAACLTVAPEAWPRVEVVSSHAGCDGQLLTAAVALGARGIIVEGTGNGTLHEALLAAARRALSQNVAVWRATRCLGGGVVGPASVDAEGSRAQAAGTANELASAGALTPAKARVELMLQLMG